MSVPCSRSPPRWRPDVFAARAPNLAARSRIKESVRRYFLDDGFAEVDTPVLQVSPGHETHVSAFDTVMIDADGERKRMFLHTSPEFACKKLLAAGVERLFTLSPVFRNRERGRLHHPEFTMLEWYRAYASLDTLVADAVALLRRAAEGAGTRMLRYRGATADPFAAAEMLTVAEAFSRHLDLDLAATLGTGGFTGLAEATARRGLRVAADDTWSDLFSKLLSAFVEPQLGLGRPTVLTRYPASEAALARLCPDDPRFAQRFELYCCGVELANAFAELTDPVEQRRRFMRDEAERTRIYGETHPLDEEFLAALDVMPDACGIALGFDRLVMLATGADTIEEVLWAPVSAGETACE